MSTIANAREEAERNIGTLLGLVGGAIIGTLEATALPTYLREQIKKDGWYTVHEAVWPESGNPQGTAYLISTTIATRHLFRWAAVAGTILDLSDGKPELLGYLAIPMVASGIYETYKATRKKKQQV
jgi:hypothetical protein